MFNKPLSAPSHGPRIQLPACAGFIFSVILVVLTEGRPVSAQPAVTLVSGTVSQGQTLLLLGSSFGSKSTPAPVVFDQMESGSFSSYWANTFGTVNGTNQRGVSSRNFTFNYTGNCCGGNQSHLTGAGSPSSRTWFMSYYFMLATDWSWNTWCSSPSNGNLANVKVFRLWSTSDSGDESAIVTMDSGPCMGNGMNWYARGAEIHSCSMSPTSLALATWHRMDIEFTDSSSSGSSDGKIRVYMDGSTVCSGDNVVFSSNASNRKRPYDMAFWNSWSDSSHSDSNTYFQDDMYIDGTLARVELCPQPTWNSRTTCELQTPLTWGPGNVSVKTNTGALPSGQTAYLYVVDANGSVNSSGYPVTVGSGATTLTPPAAPTNLRIVP